MAESRDKDDGTLVSLALLGEEDAFCALAAFGEVTRCLPPSHSYYAAAVSALRAEALFGAVKDPGRVRIACMGECCERRGGRWIFTEQTASSFRRCRCSPRGSTGGASPCPQRGPCP